MSTNRLFNTVKIRAPKRNVFDLSHEKKLSLNMGDLTPILCQEVVPGDVFKLNTDIFMRFMPMVFPVMHRINVFTHYFFVPNRIIWNQWQEFITGGESGMESPGFPSLSYEALAVDQGMLDVGTLGDYLGLPTYFWKQGISYSDVLINMLPFRAYQEIYNEYYRDQNFPETKVDFSKDTTIDLGELSDLCALRKRCWEKDYFTSALPWPQRGGQVHFPIGDKAIVKYDDQTTAQSKYRYSQSKYGNTRGAYLMNNEVSITDPPMWNLSDAVPPPGTDPRMTQEVRSNTIPGAGTNFNYDPNGSLYADLSEATATSINDLRRAFRLQEWLEKNARAGSRYVEQILSHFGVRVPDGRLQRPEYLGGGKSPVVISEVLQTSETANSPQGNMAGHGVSVGRTHSFSKKFLEHGYVIGIMSVLPRTAYSQGIPRHFLKNDKFDYYWREFANLGEQEVMNCELYAYNKVRGKLPFGYQSRYSEYKFNNDTVHGNFRNNLKSWHMAREFEDLPYLNGDFTQSDPRSDIFAYTPTSNVDNKLLCQLYHNFTAIRPMPKFGTPQL